MNLPLLSSLLALIPLSPIAIYSNGAGWSHRICPWEEGDHGPHSSTAARVFSPRNWAHTVLLWNKLQSVSFFNYTTTVFQLIWCQPLQEEFPALQKSTLTIVPMSSPTEGMNSHKNEWQTCSNLTESRIMLFFQQYRVQNARCNNIIVIVNGVLNFHWWCGVVI